MRQNGKEILWLGGQHSIFSTQNSQPQSSYTSLRKEPWNCLGYCSRSEHSAEERFRRQSTFVCDRPFLLAPRTRLDTGATHLRKWVELGCKTRVEPGSRCACERCKVGWTRVQPTLWCPCERGVIVGPLLWYVLVLLYIGVFAAASFDRGLSSLIKGGQILVAAHREKKANLEFTLQVRELCRIQKCKKKNRRGRSRKRPHR